MVAIATTICLIQAPLANAQQNDGTIDNCSTTDSVPDETVGYAATEVDKEFIAEELAHGTISHEASQNELILAKTTAVDSEDGGVFYRIPIESEFDTNYLLVERQSDQVASVAETHVSQISENEARVQVWIDGQSVHDDVVTENSIPNAQPMGVQDAWNEFKSCLNSAGVPMAIVTGITIACGFFTTFTLGTGAPVCMIAAAGIYGGTVSFCYGKALKKL